MNKSIVAGAALVAAVAIAAPMLAWSADSPAQPAPAAPASAPQAMPGMGGKQGMMGGMQGMMGGMRAEAMGHPGWMREMMMHRMMRRMMQLSPQQRCEERLARRAGMVAYVVAKLNLTPEQRPLWDKLQSLMQAAADRQHQLCASLKSAGDGGQETILDRVNRREQFLSSRLQALKETRPALELLYQALTPEQKAIIDHPFRPG
ncbi:MAG: Spy/CpxP family protein refolding chaperone [Alphaproteobacteria bacterium]